MQHDKVTRLIYLSETDSAILGGEPSPQLDTNAGSLHEKAVAIQDRYVEQLNTIYTVSGYDSTRDQLNPADLRDDAQHLARLALEFAEVRDYALATPPAYFQFR